MQAHRLRVLGSLAKMSKTQPCVPTGVEAAAITTLAVAAAEAADASSELPDGGSNKGDDIDAPAELEECAAGAFNAAACTLVASLGCDCATGVAADCARCSCNDTGAAALVDAHTSRTSPQEQQAYPACRTTLPPAQSWLSGVDCAAAAQRAAATMAIGGGAADAGDTELRRDGPVLAQVLAYAKCVAM